ncbi:hypothetical protein ACJX0J_029148 [Zea mays]
MSVGLFEEVGMGEGTKQNSGLDKRQRAQAFKSFNISKTLFDQLKFDRTLIYSIGPQSIIQLLLVNVRLLQIYTFFIATWYELTSHNHSTYVNARMIYKLQLFFILGLTKYKSNNFYVVYMLSTYMSLMPT